MCVLCLLHHTAILCLPLQASLCLRHDSINPRPITNPALACSDQVRELQASSLNQKPAVVKLGEDRTVEPGSSSRHVVSAEEKSSREASGASLSLGEGEHCPTGVESARVGRMTGQLQHPLGSKPNLEKGLTLPFSGGPVGQKLQDTSRGAGRTGSTC